MFSRALKENPPGTTVSFLLYRHAEGGRFNRYSRYNLPGRKILPPVSLPAVIQQATISPTSFAVGVGFDGRTLQPEDVVIREGVFASTVQNEVEIPIERLQPWIDHRRQGEVDQHFPRSAVSLHNGDALTLVADSQTFRLVQCRQIMLLNLRDNSPDRVVGPAGMESIRLAGTIESTFMEA